MRTKYVTKSQLARVIGVSRAAVGQAAAMGKIGLNPYGVELNSQLTVDYIRDECRQRTQLGIKSIKLLDAIKSLTRLANQNARKPLPKPNDSGHVDTPDTNTIQKGLVPEPHETRASDDKPPKTRRVKGAGANPRGKNGKNRVSVGIDEATIAAMESAFDTDNPSKLLFDIEKTKAMTAQIHLKISEQMGHLVLKSMVDRSFGHIYSAAASFLLPLGHRIAPGIAGICGITDPEVIARITTKIDEEISQSLKRIKGAAIEEIGQIDA